MHCWLYLTKLFPERKPPAYSPQALQLTRRMLQPFAQQLNSLVSEEIIVIQHHVCQRLTATEDFREVTAASLGQATITVTAPQPEREESIIWRSCDFSLLIEASKKGGLRRQLAPVSPPGLGRV